MSEGALANAAGSPAGEGSPSRKLGLSHRMARVAIWVVLLLLTVVSSLISPVFMTTRNISTLLKQAASLGIVSVGQTLAVLTGGIDLSVASVMALMSVLAASLMKGQDALFLPVVLFCLAVAVLIGLINGLLVTKLKIPAFIATLGMVLVVQGVRFVYTGGSPRGTISPTLRLIGGGMLGPVPVAVIVWVVIVVVFVILMARTTFGRRMYAVGGNRSAAHLSGVNVDAIVIAAYTLCSFLAGVAGLVYTGYNGYADNWLGRGFELNSIAATVVGGTLFEGGRGGVFGTVAGVLIITILFNMVLLLGLDEEYMRIVKGVAIILAVAMYARMRTRR